MTEDDAPFDHEVNHPAHYKAENGIEAIDVIEGFGLGFRDGNVVKYILRAGKKRDGDARDFADMLRAKLKDTKKSRWYLDREIAAIEKQLESFRGRKP